MSNAQPVSILIADDDPDDRLLTREAFSESRVPNRLDFVHDGEELLDYLNHRPPYDDPQRYPLPGLILLDLNMPCMDGRETLLAVKGDPRLSRIPVVILSTSCAEEDMERCRVGGADAYISKPTSYSGLLDVVRRLGEYWRTTVDLSLETHTS